MKQPKKDQEITFQSMANSQFERLTSNPMFLISWIGATVISLAMWLLGIAIFIDGAILH